MIKSKTICDPAGATGLVVKTLDLFKPDKERLQLIEIFNMGVIGHSFRYHDSFADCIKQWLIPRWFISQSNPLSNRIGILYVFLEVVSHPHPLSANSTISMDLIFCIATSASLFSLASFSSKGSQSTANLICTKYSITIANGRKFKVQAYLFGVQADKKSHLLPQHLANYRIRCFGKLARHCKKFRPFWQICWSVIRIYRPGDEPFSWEWRQGRAQMPSEVRFAGAK